MPWINGADAPIPVPLATEIDPETGQEIVTAWRTEYHVNLPTWPQTPDEFVAERPDLAPYRREPPLLSRIFAGDDPAAPTMTLALRFTDEAEARGVLASYWADDA